MELFHLLPVEEHLSRAWGIDAAQNADQRRLAGAVVADQADQLAGMEIHRDVLEGVEGTEMEVEVPDLDKGMSAGHARVLPRQTLCPRNRASFWLKMTAVISTTPTKVMYQDDGAPSAISS